MSLIWQDIRYAIRSLRRTPAFLVAVVLTLALGIGANTAVFSMVDAVLLHPLAVARPNELVAVYQDISDQRPRAGLSIPFVQVLRQRSHALDGFATFATTDVVVRTDAGAEQLSLMAASGNYFSLLGLSPGAGRFFTPADDDAIGAHPVVVLSDALWTRRFNRSPAAIGASLTIGGNLFTVIGVAPRGFRGTQLAGDPQLWVPLTMITNVGGRQPFTPGFAQLVFGPRFQAFSVVARLRGGATPVGAAGELNDIYAQEEHDHPSPPPSANGYPGNAVARPMSAIPIVEAAALTNRGSLVRFMTILFAVVALTLLTACVNVANLLLVRGEERLGELSLRASLGASRARITRQLLVESGVLALAGASAGFVLQDAMVSLLSRFALPGGLSLATMNLSAGPRVLGFAILLAVVTALIIGLIPALRASRPDLTTVLRAHGAAGRRNGGAWLLGIQVAMSLVLLVGAGLFVRSMQAGLSSDIGFDPRPLAAIEADPRSVGYKPDDTRSYYADILRRAQAIPGVSAAAIATHVPLAPLGGGLPFVGGAATPVTAWFVSVTPSYFDVIRVPITDGRAFNDGDDPTKPSVVILNETAAKMLFPDGNPLGRDITHAGSFTFTVVGVVRDTKYASISDAKIPVIYMALSQALGSWGGRGQIVIRSTNPQAALDALTRELASVPPSPPLRNARLVSAQLDATLMPQRFGATLLGLFSLIALAIAAVGIYGVIAYTVARRQAEIGIRVALGAPRADVLRAVIARNALVVAIGIVLGLAGAGLASGALASFLYGIRPLDPAAFGMATAAMLGAAVLASIIPARRALRTDPMTVLRQ